MRRKTKKKCFITWRSRPWRTTRYVEKVIYGGLQGISRKNILKVKLIEERCSLCRRRISRKAVTSLQSFTTTSHCLAQNNILTSRPTFMEVHALILAFEQARAAKKEKRRDCKERRRGS